MKKALKYALLGLLALLVVAQLFRIDKTNPPADPAQDMMTLLSPPAAVSTILKDACYDCHSNLTKYPWYTNVAPVSWWIKDHIDEGRGHLNYSEWGTYSPKKAAHKMEECVEMTEEGEMPMDSYTWAHPEARLTAEQRSTLVDWFKATHTQLVAIRDAAAPEAAPEAAPANEEGNENHEGEDKN
ncbi:MAG: heme-binding domain-containing protein [Lewinellaceae bacterium]|nr:heme-binding domain-containing protein [Lewinellaceae bacterium]